MPLPDHSLTTAAVMWGKWSPTRDTAVDLGIYQPLYERRLQEYRNERERWRRRGERPPAPAGKEEEAAPYSLHKLAGACGSSFLMGVLCATPYYGCQVSAWSFWCFCCRLLPNCLGRWVEGGEGMSFEALDTPVGVAERGCPHRALIKWSSPGSEIG